MNPLPITRLQFATKTAEKIRALYHTYGSLTVNPFWLKLDHLIKFTCRPFITMYTTSGGFFFQQGEGEAEAAQMIDETFLAVCAPHVLSLSCVHRKHIINRHEELWRIFDIVFLRQFR